MNESLEELKAIIDNAPDGATHFGIDCVYYQYEKADSIAVWREYYKRKSNFVLNKCICMMDLRSLSDIKRIIELMERVKSGYEAYSRIELIKQKYNAENKQMKELLKDIVENEDLDDCRFLAVEKALKGNWG